MWFHGVLEWMPMDPEAPPATIQLSEDQTPRGPRQTMYKYLALGWTGQYEQWRHYARTYLCLACLVTPLVISVHSVVS